MSVDILKLKMAAEAATSGQWVADGEYKNSHGNLLYAYVAHKNGGRIAEAFANCLVKTDKQCRANAHFIATANPPTVLALIAEIERHRQVEAEGCKPDSSILRLGVPCTGSAVKHGLDKAEDCKSDLNIPIHPGDMTAITEQHREFMKLTDYGWMDDASSLQDQAYALGHERGRTEQALNALAVGLTGGLPAVAIEGDQLVIRITTECLLHAVTCSSQWPTDEAGSPISIKNGPLLIEEIIHELQREDEQGTNQMHHMFDAAALAALDNGSEAVSYDEQDELCSAEQSTP